MEVINLTKGVAIGQATIRTTTIMEMEVVDRTSISLKTITESSG
jgi:uncharacterized protein (DUF433 family)